MWSVAHTASLQTSYKWLKHFFKLTVLLSACRSYFRQLKRTAMHIYKISFLKNQVLSITEAEPGTHFDGSMFYEEVKGQLIFAIVKAKSREAAEEIAKEIVDSVKE